MGLENVVPVSRLFRAVRQKITQRKLQSDINAYIRNGKKPWSRGYSLSKFKFIQNVLNDDVLLAKFLALEPLPSGYGYGYDERVVEYPWAFARLSQNKGKLLDAGSVLNYRNILENSVLLHKKITIFTLAPENKAFWEKGISYSYGDLRELPFRENWFDEIISISTLGHVGMDNRIYAKDYIADKIGLEAESAVKELIRVLRPRGKFLISVVFGKHQLIEWDGSPFAEQFDSTLLNDLLRMFSSNAGVSVSFYKYTENGWNISTEKECQGLEYFNIHTATSFDSDNAAAARSVALIEVTK